VASDCLQVINDLKDDYVGSYSMITDEIKNWAEDFPRIIFRHEKRASNHEAHRVARSFVSVNLGRQVWLLEPPAELCMPLFINQ
jgi:hypothetical protein